MPCAAEAAKALKELESDPKVRAKLREEQARKLDDLLNGIVEAGSAKDASGADQKQISEDEAKQTRRDEPSRAEKIKGLVIEKQDRALEILEKLASLYGDTEAGREASKDLETLKADTELMAAVEKHRRQSLAKGLYDVAVSYMKAGLKDKALKQFEKVVEEFPESDAAADARSQIAKLRNRES